MSAVLDEADDGPPKLDRDDEIHDENGLASEENESMEGLPSNTFEEDNEGQDEDDTSAPNGTTIRAYGNVRDDLLKEGSDVKDVLQQAPLRPSSADGSFSIPGDTPSVQGSIPSSPGRGAHLSSYGHSPAPSLRPFDRRFHARASSSPLHSPRASSPAFFNLHSRQTSASHSIQDTGNTEILQAPWEVVRWTKLRNITGQALSEVGKRNFGRPTCIAVSASIALGTSKGVILVFDYNQHLKSIIGPGTKAIESGSVTSISISADHSVIAGGHASGSIFTWEVAKPAKPFLHIPPVDRNRTPNTDGHVLDVAILHVGFLGLRHTALASADDMGMAFSHLATRGMGAVSRSVKTTRILGRYPERNVNGIRPRKPSSVLSFSPLPLGNAEHGADSMGLVAMLTPYLLVVVSTTPIAQTQYKTPRPKEVAAHGAMTAALAWFPSVKLKTKDTVTTESSSRVKLVYCWSNILTVLEVVEAESSSSGGKEEPPGLQFRSRSRWKAEEAIVGVQWLSRSVLAVLTITQQLVIVEDNSMIVTDSSDLIQRHIYHTDLFSSQLNQLVDQLEDEENAAMHGVVADAFYMSFRAYKGRLFLLGFNEISLGTLSNWADRLLALMEEGSYIGAIQLATSYFNGEANKIAVGLPEDDTLRHELVQEKLSEMISASLKYAFGTDNGAKERRLDQHQIKELASTCTRACVSMGDTDFLFEDVYTWYQGEDDRSVFLDAVEPYIVEDEISVIPPIVLKDLVGHYTTRGFNARLEEIICHLDSRTMDLDQITTLCKRNQLYDALLYVWNQALHDYTTIMADLMDIAKTNSDSRIDRNVFTKESQVASASKLFPYLSYILTGRVYPTGTDMPRDSAILAKAEIYHFFFSGNSSGSSPQDQRKTSFSHVGAKASFPNLQEALDIDAPSFLSMLNEAFEDSFLNGPQDRMTEEIPGQLTEEQKFGLSVNRQWIVSILLEVMTAPNYKSDDTIYLNMFIARNLPKFPQFILLPGHILHRVLVGLCQYPSDDLADDCQLSVEYLLSIYQPPDLATLIPLISQARFFRVLKSIFKAEKQYADLLKTCFDDYQNPEAIFECIGDCLRPSAKLGEKQINDVRAVILDHASDLVAADVTKAASTIEQYASDLHSILLASISGDDSARFQYLQTVLEPSEPKSPINQSTASQRTFVELYVRLLCHYDPSHVSKYVEQLDTGDIRLDEVLPAIDNSGIVDAAVVLLAREGKVKEGLGRLIHHLQKLESALLGLLDGAQDIPDAANSVEAGQDLIKSVQKYARVGVWLCQEQTKAVQQSRLDLSRTKTTKSLHDTLSPDENFWLDLIDAVVAVTKNVTEVLQGHEQLEEPSDSNAFDPTKMIVDLRTVVQETFTALLATTSAPRTSEARRTDVSFLKILRAFLSRASLLSPSLSNLRAVLGAIFSAYSYEESLLSLTNRLLDKDLFVHVTEADRLRRRGWRPLGQVCEGCGKRVWGPGAGGHIWDAWQRSNEDRKPAPDKKIGDRVHQLLPRDGNGKGKAVTKDNEASGGMQIREPANGSSNERWEDESGPVVIFSCRHMFHRSCLEEVQSPGNDGQTKGVAGAGLFCPLCA